MAAGALLCKIVTQGQRSGSLTRLSTTPAVPNRRSPTDRKTVLQSPKNSGCGRMAPQIQPPFNPAPRTLNGGLHLAARPTQL